MHSDTPRVDPQAVSLDERATHDWTTEPQQHTTLGQARYYIAPDPPELGVQR